MMSNLSSDVIECASDLEPALNTVNTNSQHVTKITGISNNGTHLESGVEASLEQIRPKRQAKRKSIYEGDLPTISKKVRHI